jgi:site-specific recombinase XerC
MDLCIATNQGRIEGNKRAQALRRSLNVDSTILHEAALFQRRMGDKQAARSLQRRADQFTRIATTLANLPPIDCKS